MRHQQYSSFDDKGIVSCGNDAAAVAQLALSVIDDGKLARGDALHILLALDDPLAVAGAGELAAHDVRRVTVLEHDVNGAVNTLPRVARDEVHLVEVERATILLGRAVAVRDVDDVVIDVLAHHIPRTAAQAQAFALPDCVEPIAAVLAQLAASLQLDDGAGTLAQVAADEVVIVDLTQEADTLAVTTMRIGQAHFLGDAAHLLLGHVAYREHDMAQLLVGDLGQEIGLVLDGVDRCGQVFHAVDDSGRGIMARRRHVKVLAPALLKEAELDHAVTHHVGVGREAGLDGAQGILHHVVPILLVQRHHLERQAVTMRDEGAHLDVLLGAAIALVVVHADADVEQVQVLALLLELVDHHGTVNAT